MESTFKPALKLMAGRILAFAGTFFIPVVLVRIFEPAEFGTYKQLFLLFGTLYVILQVGMAESLYYFLPRRPERAGSFVVNAVLWLGLVGGLSLGGLHLFGGSLAAWLGNSDLARYAPWIGAILLFTLASAVLEIVLISRKRIFWAAFSYGASDLLRAGLLIAPALIMRDLLWVLVGGAAFALLRLTATLAYTIREFSGALRPDLGLLRQQLLYTLPFGLAVVIEVIQLNYHQYAVAYYFDAATFAIYAVGCLQIPLVEFLANPTANVMMVRMGEGLRDGESSSLIALWHDATRKLALVFCPLLVFILISARDIIVLLFTEAYAAAVPVFMVWSFMILLAVFPTDGVLRVFASMRFLLVLNIGRLIFIAAMIGWFVSYLGLVGAAAVTVLALAFAKAAALVRIGRLLQVSARDLIRWRDAVRIAAIAVAAGAPVILFRAEADLALPLVLSIGAVIYAGSYGGMMALFGVLTAGEKGAIAAWLHRLKAPAAAGERQI